MIIYNTYICIIYIYILYIYIYTVEGYILWPPLTGSSILSHEDGRPRSEPHRVVVGRSGSVAGLLRPGAIRPPETALGLEVLDLKALVQQKCEKKSKVFHIYVVLCCNVNLGLINP